MIDDLQIPRGLLLMVISLFIFTAFFSLTRNAEEMSGNIIKTSEGKNEVLIKESDILNKDGLLVLGSEVLNTISKFQNEYSVIVKTQYSIKEYTAMNPFVKNMPCNLDYVEPEDYYLCRIFKDTNTGDLVSIAFTLQGTYNTGEPIEEYSPLTDKASAYIMFTEDYNFKVPTNVKRIRLSACASGLGRLAGDYIGESQREPLYVEVANDNGDELTQIHVTIRYEGITKIEFYNQKGELAKFKVVGGSNSNTNDTDIIKRPGKAYPLKGYYDTITLQPGIVNWAIPTFLFTEFYSGINGTDSSIFTSGENANGFYVSGEKGLGGFGGAFGFGGGGGTPALAVYGVNEDMSTTHYMKRALGGTSGGSVVTRPTVVAEGGLGSSGLNIFAEILGYTNQTEVLDSEEFVKYQKILNGGNGGNGTLTSAGNGGTITYPEDPELGVISFNNALGLGVQTALDRPFYMLGASGGGAGGGYGAGGGLGGGGIAKTIYYVQEGNKFTIATTPIDSVSCNELNVKVNDGSSGMPSCGMVYIKCETE